MVAQMWRALVCLSTFNLGSAMQLHPRAALVHAPRSSAPALNLKGDEPSLPSTKLDDFLVLMGRCYAGAGLAHAADFATGNALPAAAGLPPFALLPPAGQALGVVWVLIGVLQPIASTRAAQQAGLIAYGAYEIILTLAAWTATSDPDGNLMRLGAAAGVQAVVGYCFVELRRQSIEAAAPKIGARGRSPPPRMMVGRPAPRPGRGGKGDSAERGAAWSRRPLRRARSSASAPPQGACLAALGSSKPPGGEARPLTLEPLPRVL